MFRPEAAGAGRVAWSDGATSRAYHEDVYGCRQAGGSDVLQASLIETSRVRTHMWIGSAAAVLAVGVVVSGLVVLHGVIRGSEDLAADLPHVGSTVWGNLTVLTCGSDESPIRSSQLEARGSSLPSPLSVSSSRTLQLAERSYCGSVEALVVAQVPGPRWHGERYAELADRRGSDYRSRV